MPSFALGHLGTVGALLNEEALAKLLEPEYLQQPAAVVLILAVVATRKLEKNMPCEI